MAFFSVGWGGVQECAGVGNLDNVMFRKFFSNKDTFFLVLVVWKARFYLFFLRQHFDAEKYTIFFIRLNVWQYTLYSL